MQVIFSKVTNVAISLIQACVENTSVPLQDRAIILIACRSPKSIRVLRLELTEKHSGKIPKIQSFAVQGT